jgi:hypothetical protein
MRVLRLVTSTSVFTQNTRLVNDKFFIMNVTSSCIRLGYFITAPNSSKCLNQAELERSECRICGGLRSTGHVFSEHLGFLSSHVPPMFRDHLTSGDGTKGSYVAIERNSRALYSTINWFQWGDLYMAGTFWTRTVARAGFLNRLNWLLRQKFQYITFIVSAFLTQTVT